MSLLKGGEQVNLVQKAAQRFNVSEEEMIAMAVRPYQFRNEDEIIAQNVRWYREGRRMSDYVYRHMYEITEEVIES